jgi:hypothetical protein
LLTIINKGCINEPSQKVSSDSGLGWIIIYPFALQVHNAICCTRNTCTAYVTFSCRRMHREPDMCVNELHAHWVYDFCAIGSAVALIPLFVRRALGVNIIMRCSHFMRLCLTDSQRDEFIIALHVLTRSLYHSLVCCTIVLRALTVSFHSRAGQWEQAEHV